MNSMERFFASLKRLFEPRTQPPAESLGEPIADRPLPPEADPISEPATPAVIPAVDDAADVSEVRTLLEAVAEAPVSAAESKAEVRAPAAEPTPTFPQASTEEVVDVPSTAPDRVGDALVLTLATPAATFRVAKAAATIGRGQENTIRLDDLSVSRQHARIAYKQGGYWLSDRGSVGGTWVDGARLAAPQRIEAGQVIDIGLCRLTVGYAGGTAKAETKKSARPQSEMAEQGRRRR